MSADKDRGMRQKTNEVANCENCKNDGRNPQTCSGRIHTYIISYYRNRGYKLSRALIVSGDGAPCHPISDEAELVSESV